MTIDPIGIAGEGEIAAAVAAGLAGRAGVRVIVHGFDAATPPKGRLERAANLFDLASECEVVVAVYASHAALRSALAGDEDRPGLLAAMAPGTLLVDMSAGLPGECLRLAGQLAGRAIGLVEIGRRGGLEAFAKGEASLYAGGYGEHIETVRPVLSHLGSLRRAGPQGSGRMFVALEESVRATYHAALAEAQAVAAAGGIVPDELAEPPLSAAECLQFEVHLEAARAIAAAHAVGTPLIDAVAAVLKRPRDPST